MDEIQRVLIKQGRKDLAQKYYEKVAASQKKAFGDKEIHAKDKTWIFMHNRVNEGFHNFYIYYDASNIGRRGKTVTQYQYQLMIPKDHASNIAWGATIASKIKPTMSYKNMMSEFMKAAEEPKRKANAELKGPYEYKEKGISKRLPEPEWAEKFENKSQGNLSIAFKKPNVRIYGKKEQEEADKGHMIVYIDIKWNYAKKVNLLKDDILKAQTLKGAEKVLTDNKIKYKYNHYMDPMWQ